MDDIEDLCKTTGKLHCPTAPALIVADYLLRIYKVETKEGARLSRVTEICKTLDYAAMAIKHYHKKRDVILQLPEDFEQRYVSPLMSRDKGDETA